MICFYRLVGRVQTLKVPARRLRALTRGASCDSRIEELNAVSKVLENLDKPDRTVSRSFRIAVINQYGEKNCVTVDESVWEENRTVSLWIN